MTNTPEQQARAIACSCDDFGLNVGSFHFASCDRQTAQILALVQKARVETLNDPELRKTFVQNVDYHSALAMRVQRGTGEYMQLMQAFDHAILSATLFWEEGAKK